MTLGERVQQLRLEKRLSKEELAKQISISSTSISNIESNKNNPTSETIIAFSNFFNKSTDWILKGVEFQKEPYMGNDEQYEGIISILSELYLDKSIKGLENKSVIQIVNIFEHKLISGIYSKGSEPTAEISKFLSDSILPVLRGFGLIVRSDPEHGAWTSMLNKKGKLLLEFYRDDLSKKKM